MANKPLYRSSLSFNRATMKLGGAGISMDITDYGQINQKTAEQFGLFGTDGDTSKYFPEVKTAKDVEPKSDQFVYVPFRLLSATIVGAGSWKATDFTDENMLRASIDKMNGKTVYFDHEQGAMNFVGKVDSVSWSDERMQDGVKIPGGMDAVLAIDAVTNPKLARGVLMRTVMSNSVTVVFDWIPSHEGMDEDTFYNNLGKVIDGKMVSRKVTAIHDYHETSLCWLGADPFSKMYDENGNLINVDTSAVFENEPENVRREYKQNNTYASSMFCYSKKQAEILTTSGIENSFKPNNNTKNMDEKLTAFLCSFLGLEKDTKITEDHFKDLVILKKDEHVSLQAAKDIADKVNEIAQKPGNITEFLSSHKFVSSDIDIESLQNSQIQLKSIREELKAEENADLKQTVVKLMGDAKIGLNAVSDKRNEVLRLYKVQVGANEDSAVIDLINTAAPEQLNGLLKMYIKGVTDEFKGTCKKCGSTEVSFRSSKASEEEITDEVKTHVKPSSFQDIYKEESQSTMFSVKDNK